MRWLFLLFLLVVLNSHERAYSQDCPHAYVSCPDTITGGSIAFYANVSLYDPNQSYKWTVSGGRIIRGQGTTSIIVDTAGLVGQSMTATIEVIGFPTECGNKASCSIITCQPPPARKFDEYGDLPWSALRTRRTAVHPRKLTHRGATHRLHRRKLPQARPINSRTNSPTRETI